MKYTGWRYESSRHSLAARGIKTKYNYQARTGLGGLVENVQDRNRALELRQDRLAGQVQKEQLTAEQGAVNKVDLIKDQEDAIKAEQTRLETPLRGAIGEKRKKNIDELGKQRRNAEIQENRLDAQLVDVEETIVHAQDELKEIALSRGTPEKKAARSVLQRELISELEARKKDILAQKESMRDIDRLSVRELKRLKVKV